MDFVFCVGRARLWEGEAPSVPIIHERTRFEGPPQVEPSKRAEPAMQKLHFDLPQPVELSRQHPPHEASPGPLFYNDPSDCRRTGPCV